MIHSLVGFVIALAVGLTGIGGGSLLAVALIDVRPLLRCSKHAPKLRQGENGAVTRRRIRRHVSGQHATEAARHRLTDNFRTLLGIQGKQARETQKSLLLLRL